MMSAWVGLFIFCSSALGMSSRLTTIARSQCALTAHDAMRHASRIFWIFSGSTCRSGSKKRIDRREPINSWYSIALLLGRENVNRHRRGVTSQEATAVFGESYARVIHLAGAASPAQLVGDFHDLRDSGGANRMALREESAAGIDHVASAEIHAPPSQEPGTLAPRAQSKFLACDEFCRRRCVVDLEHVDVRRPDTCDFVSSLGHALQRRRFVGCAVTP